MLPDDDAPVVPEVVELLLVSALPEFSEPLVLPEEPAPVVPDVPELLDVPELPDVPLSGDLYSGFDLAESFGSTFPDALPVAEPKPDAEPDTDPLALGKLLELPDELEPLGVDDAHAASVKAQTTGIIHLFIEISFVFFIESKATSAYPTTSRHALSM